MMKYHLHPTLLCAALASLMLGGCAINQPTAQVLHVRITEETEQGTRMELAVQLDNPNDFALPLPSASYTIRIADAGVFTFTDIPTTTLPAHGSQTLVFPAAFAHTGSLSGSNYSASGHILYRPLGQFRALLSQYKIPLPSAGFTATGQLQ
jgi:hypothetical protein